MDQNEVQNPGHVPQPSAEFGSVRNDSESFRKVPNGSEAFRTVQKDSEGFRSVPKAVERTENHTLTVRETARMFEAAGVARTERSVVNWCQPNRQGVARLDAYFDPNERKYYITAESVERAVAEEKTKAIRSPESSETVGTVPKDAERETRRPVASDQSGLVQELELQVRDLTIATRLKDQVIAMNEQVIKRLEETKDQYIERLIESGHRIGELETQLLQLEAPEETSSETVDLPRKLQVTKAV